MLFYFTAVVTNQKCQPLAADLVGKTGDVLNLNAVQKQNDPSYSDLPIITHTHGRI